MTNEESTERYALEIGRDVVEIWDESQEKTIAGFSGPDRLLAATTELNRLKGQGVLPAMVDRPHVSPSDFLTKTLPALARRQRIESRLTVVREHETHLAARLADATADHAQAVALRERLEKELSDHLSATETAQNAPVGGLDTIENLIRQGALRAFEPVERDLFKPQPY